MAATASEQAEKIVRRLETAEMPPFPFEEVMELVLSHPNVVKEFAISVMCRYPRGGTFLDAALSYLPEDEWPELIGAALEVLQQAEQRRNQVADAIFEYASLQSPQALHPHLDQIFALGPNSNTYFEFYPWRESGVRHFDSLRSVIERVDGGDDKPRAWQAMCETREVSVLEWACQHAKMASLRPVYDSLNETVSTFLRLVGIERRDEAYSSLCPKSLFHIIFPADFFDGGDEPHWYARIHPTWSLSGPALHAEFGGRFASECRLCGRQLQSLLSLTEVPSEIGVTEIPCLNLSACLSCLGWEAESLFYQHDTHGRIESIGYHGPRVTPQFPARPLRQSRVELVRTPRRWYWQDWGASNFRENLNRIGGEPSWIQDADYPNCILCHRVMHFLMQLDSNLPIDNDDEWLWGSGGIGYGFWCDDCNVSAWSWQCT